MYVKTSEITKKFTEMSSGSMRSLTVCALWVVVLFIGLPVAWAQSDPNTKIADRFKVRFASAKYATSTSVVPSSEGRRDQTTEYLRLIFEVGILDPNLVLGISRQGIITQFKNNKGEIIDVVDQMLPRSPIMHNSYGALRYGMGFVLPPKAANWKTATQSARRLPPPKSSRPQWGYKIEPSRMRLELDSGLLGPDSEKINCVKGHFYVLMAKSLEHIEIPFEPNETWVRLTPDLEIKVLEAKSTESNYQFRIETRPGERAFNNFIHPGSDLPNRFPVNRQWIDKDGKLSRQHFVSRPLPLPVGGGGRGSDSAIGRIEKIRYVIAVNASHHKIPFELEDITLPEPPVVAIAQEPNLPTTQIGEKAHIKEKAHTPKLKDGDIHKATWASLSWKPGSKAVSHNVYLGIDFDDVNSPRGPFRGNQPLNSTYLVVGFTGYAYPDGLVPGTTYYWRIDEVNDADPNSPWKGDVWSFTVASNTAYSPDPPNGDNSVDPNVQLSWTPGLCAVLHTVYFGDDFGYVSTATKGKPQGAKTYDPGLLELNKTYYWRVDEFDESQSTHKGDVWSFTVNGEG